ncbi:hypothetical protein [Methanoregula sp.]|uniref:hypothetical protein n=1 Tax=Methanoregula sp. TaxID=2052170 RepID=UPI00236B29E7|nr:hypothetical protein [Methanoregula sp.]MDD1686047.1 hypothetical protein [Methanoregula sp.]
MSGSYSEMSPFTRLVLFMVCLSVAGSVVAGVNAWATSLHNTPVPPKNGDCSDEYCEAGEMDCYWNYGCREQCQWFGQSSEECYQCYALCGVTYYSCCWPDDGTDG